MCCFSDVACWPLWADVRPLTAVSEEVRMDESRFVSL